MQIHFQIGAKLPLTTFSFGKKSHFICSGAGNLPSAISQSSEIRLNRVLQDLFCRMCAAIFLFFSTDSCCCCCCHRCCCCFHKSKSVREMIVCSLMCMVSVNDRKNFVCWSTLLQNARVWSVLLRKRNPAQTDHAGGTLLFSTMMSYPVWFLNHGRGDVIQ